MTLNDWPLRKKFQINALVFFVSFILLMGASLTSFSYIKQQFDEVAADSVPDIVAILELKSQSKRLFAEIQGFVATGDDDEIEEFYEALEKFDEWHSRWTVDPNDTVELTLKQLMDEHKTRFSEYLHTIIALENEKLKLIDEFEQLRNHLLEETSGSDSESDHNQNDLVDRIQRETYYQMLVASEEGDDEKSSVAEDGEESRYQVLLDMVLKQLSQIDVKQRVSMIEQALDVSKRLIQVDESIGENLEYIEEYEEQILDTLDEAVALQTDEISDVFAQVDHLVEKFSAFIAILGIVSLLIILFVLRIVTSSIADRLGAIVYSVNRVARGDLDCRTEINGLDEFGQLGSNFDEMARSLSETTVSKTYLDNILTSMTESLMVVSPSGVIEVVNEELLDTLGYEREELIGKSISLILPNDNNVVLQALDTENQRYRSECCYMSKSGKSFSVMFSSSHLRNHAGELHSVICVAADISQLKSVQMKLEQTNINLQTAQSQLIQASKLASIGELSAGVAHELNQPLMIIRNGVQMVERRHRKGTLDDERIEKYIGSVLANTKRMMKIIDHLRTFSRRSSTEFNALSINKVITDSFFMVGEQLRLHGISVNMQISEAEYWVLGDENQLEQVILNLFSNARDALDMAEVENKQLTITTRVSDSDDQFVEILVTDNGHGIPSEVSKLIFDPFYTTKEEGKGTGLGLSISYGIINAHQGTIDIAQTGEHGTTMRVRLPVIDPRA